MSNVRRALIPCGGRGTRMLALTGGAPKELLPTAGVSALGWVARECAASGVTDLLVVIGPGKETIADYLHPLAGTDSMPARIEIAIQPEPRGLADAIRLGRDFAGVDPLGVALPDNLFVDDAPGLAQVAESYARTGKNVVGVVEIFTPCGGRARRHPRDAAAPRAGAARWSPYPREVSRRGAPRWISRSGASAGG